jgi:pyruvate ferredoxin oxidoreductase alpha subunit
MQLASENALVVHEEAAAEFKSLFGRCYGLIDTYRIEDAEYVLVMSNSFATKGRAAVDRFRQNGVRAGLLRLRVLRPFPAVAIHNALAGRRAVAVIDQNMSVGFGGITFSEIASAMYSEQQRPPILSFIGGLGGKDITNAEFDQILVDMKASSDSGLVPAPRLLYTKADQAQIEAFLKIAGKEVHA